jgi:hypothetical protein
VSSEGASSLGARLAEMDRLLRDIQAELLPDHEPSPALIHPGSPHAHLAPEAAPAPTPTLTTPQPTPDPQLQALTELSARLLASMRELLAGYERMLVRSSSRRPAGRSAPSRAGTGTVTGDRNVTVSAAPFRSLEALREFEQAVSNLPGVREVAIQGYEGTDRAIIEVRLDPPR